MVSPTMPARADARRLPFADPLELAQMAVREADGREPVQGVMAL